MGLPGALALPSMGWAMSTIILRANTCGSRIAWAMLLTPRAGDVCLFQPLQPVICVLVGEHGGDARFDELLFGEPRGSLLKTRGAQRLDRR